MKVQVSASSADLKFIELGTVEGAEAERLFTAHGWQAELDRAAELDARHEDCVDPDMTFTALPAHLIVSAAAPNQFNVEVCLPHQKKLFGLFKRSKFYEFKSISMARAAELIQAFCRDVPEQKHAFYAAQVRADELAGC